MPPKGTKVLAALNISNDGSALFFYNIFLPAGYLGSIDDSGNFTAPALSEGGMKLVEISENSYEFWLIEAEDDITKIPLEKFVD